MMAPTIKYIGNQKFRVVQDWCYESYIVPKGFETDLASIPSILSPLFPKVGDNLPAAILHDFLYSAKSPYGLTRKNADLEFLKAMGQFGVKAWRRWLMYCAVRTFGWMFYK